MNVERKMFLTTQSGYDNIEDSSAMTTKEEQMLLHLLGKALARDSQQTSYNRIDDADIHGNTAFWHALLQMADAHAVLPMLYDVLQPFADQMDVNDREYFKDRSLVCARQYYYLNYQTVNVQEALAREGIQTAVFKGVCAASYYSVPAFRKSGDVDLFLLRAGNEEAQQAFPAAQLRKAEQVLRQMGFQKEPRQTTVYHVVFTRMGNPDVELHTFLSEPFENAKANETIQQIQDSGRLGLRQIVTEGSTIQTFSEVGVAFSLIIHMLHHYMRSGFGLKFLADWVVFWNRHSEKEDPVGKEYSALIAACGIAGFSDTVTGVCRRYLGLHSEAVSDQTADDALCRDFLSDILESREFGYADTARTVALEGSGLFSYLREFHHRMKLNYPGASKHVLLYPLLWTGTLVKFLRNNHAIRHTSLRKVLKKAGTRGRMSKRMHLFQ